MSTVKQAKANVEPVRQRTQYSCMAASMMMCLRALGHPVNEDEVNNVLGARPMRGAAWEQILATAQHYGCRATLTMPATVEQLKAWTDQGVPVMIAWNPEGRPWSHASVVFDVDENLNVYVADPNIPNPKKTVRVVSEDDFYGKWYEKFPDYLVRRPACAIEREVTEVGTQVMPRMFDDPEAFVPFRSGDHMKTASRTASTPKSVYDRIPQGMRPFGWATPAPDFRGNIPAPWRVAHADRALVWLKGMFPQNKDIYVEHNSEQRGKMTLWVGLRDNRDKQAHYTRILMMADDLKKAGYPVYRDRNGAYLLLMDDLDRNVLRGKTAKKGPQTAPKTQQDRDKDKNKLRGEAPKQRNDVARGLAERGNAGGGKHKNKKDYDRGHARRPKHRNQMEWKQASGELWSKWLRLAPNVDETALASLLQYIELEGMEAGTPKDALEMLAWDWGYQGTKLPTNRNHYANVLATQLRVNLKKHHVEGAKAKAGEKYAAYSGNPDGKPIYDVKIDHGEHQALSGGHDIMKRLQDQYRIEQGHSPREPNPRLAADKPEIQIRQRRVRVNSAFVQKLKQLHRGYIMDGSPRGGFTLVHPQSDNDPMFDGGSDYDFYFAPATDIPGWPAEKGWYDVVYSPGYLVLLQKDADKIRATTTRLARYEANSRREMTAAADRVARRFIASRRNS